MLQRCSPGERLAAYGTIVLLHRIPLRWVHLYWPTLETVAGGRGCVGRAGQADHQRGGRWRSRREDPQACPAMGGADAPGVTLLMHTANSRGRSSTVCREPAQLTVFCWQFQRHGQVIQWW